MVFVLTPLVWEQSYTKLKTKEKMSTRSTINFIEDGQLMASVYKHSDGYPEGKHGVLKIMKRFFKKITKQTDDHRFNDSSYLAAKLVVHLAERYKKDTDEYRQQYNQQSGGSLDFLGIGLIINPLNIGDAQHHYTVDCSKHKPNGYPTVKEISDRQLEKICS